MCPGEMSLLCLVLAQRGTNLPPGWGTRWWLREEDRAGSGLMGRRRRWRPRQECDNPWVHFARSRESWTPLLPLQVLEAKRGSWAPCARGAEGEAGVESHTPVWASPDSMLVAQANSPQGWLYCALRWLLIPESWVGFPEPHQWGCPGGKESPAAPVGGRVLGDQHSLLKDESPSLWAPCLGSLVNKAL